MQIHEKIKEARIKKGWTQDRIAEEMETTQAMIWRYESGRTQMTAAVLKRYCEILNVSADEILGLK